MFRGCRGEPVTEGAGREGKGAGEGAAAMTNDAGKVLKNKKGRSPDPLPGGALETAILQLAGEAASNKKEAEKTEKGHSSIMDKLDLEVIAPTSPDEQLAPVAALRDPSAEHAETSHDGDPSLLDAVVTPHNSGGEDTGGNEGATRWDTVGATAQTRGALTNGVHDVAPSTWRKVMLAQRLPSGATMLFLFSGAVFVCAVRSRGRRRRSKRQVTNCAQIRRAHERAGDIPLPQGSRRRRRKIKPQSKQDGDQARPASQMGAAFAPSAGTPARKQVPAGLDRSSLPRSTAEVSGQEAAAAVGKVSTSPSAEAAPAIGAVAPRSQPGKYAAQDAPTSHANTVSTLSAGTPAPQQVPADTGRSPLPRSTTELAEQEEEAAAVGGEAAVPPAEVPLREATTPSVVVATPLAVITPRPQPGKNASQDAPTSHANAVSALSAGTPVPQQVPADTGRSPLPPSATEIADQEEAADAVGGKAAVPPAEVPLREATTPNVVVATPLAVITPRPQPGKNASQDAPTSHANAVSALSAGTPVPQQVPADTGRSPLPRSTTELAEQEEEADAVGGEAAVPPAEVPLREATTPNVVVATPLAVVTPLPQPGKHAAQDAPTSHANAVSALSAGAPAPQQVTADTGRSPLPPSMTEIADQEEAADAVGGKAAVPCAEVPLREATTPNVVVATPLAVVTPRPQPCKHAAQDAPKSHTNAASALSAGTPAPQQVPSTPPLPRSTAEVANQEAAAAAGEESAAAGEEAAIATSVENAPAVVVVVSARPRLGEHSAHATPDPLSKAALAPSARTPAPQQASPPDTGGSPSIITPDTVSPATSSPPHSAGAISDQPLPASVGGSATNPSVEAPARDAAHATVVIVSPGPQPGAASAKAVVTRVVEPQFKPSAGATVDAEGPDAKTPPRLGARAGQASKSLSVGASADANRSTAVSPEAATSSKQGTTDPVVPPTRVRTGGRATTDRKSAAHGGRTGPTEPVGSEPEAGTSPQVGARKGRVGQSPSVGSSADADGSAATEPRGSRASKQESSDPVVPPPRAQSEVRPNTGNNRAGKAGATKPGGSGSKGGACRQLGSQKGGKKGRQGSSSARDGDGKRQGSASSGNTPRVVPKLRGMINDGYTCFLLSAVQVLRKMPECHEKLLAFPGSDTPPQGKELTWAVSQTLKALQSEDDVGPLDPTDLVETFFSTFDGLFERGRPGDMSLALVSILSKLDEETRDLQTGASIVDSARWQLSVEHTCHRCKEKSTKESEVCFVLQLTLPLTKEPTKGWFFTKLVEERTRLRRDGDRPCETCQIEIISAKTEYEEKERQANDPNQPVITMEEVAKGYVFHGMERSSTIETITHVPQEMCLNVGRFVDVDNRSLVKVSAQALMHRKNVFGGKVKGMAKLAAIGSHIPHPLGYGHWTASHIVTKATRREFSDHVVADKLIKTLDPRHTTVALYVAT